MNIENKTSSYPSIDKPWLKWYDEAIVSSDLPQRTLYSYLYENNKDYKERVALNYFGRKIKYGELFENIEKTARSLKANGIGENSIVTISMPTLPETVYLLYAISKIGATANMVDPRTSSEGILDYINEVNSEFLIVLDVAYPKIQGILSKTNVKKTLVISPADSLPPIIKTLYKVKNKTNITYSSNCITWKSFIEEGKNYSKSTDCSYEQNKPVVIVHTGGTTGRPKGVLLSTYNLNAAAFQCQYCGLDFKRDHKWLNIMPPFIAYGVGNGLHLPLIIGMEVVLIPQFDPNKFDELLIKHRPNHMVGVPSHYGNIINSNKMQKHDLSHIITAIVGGDTMDSELEKQTNIFFKEHNCPNQIIKGYGMTEVCAAVSVCTSNECNKIGSVGIPLTHTIISIFNPENGEELAYNTQGEVCMTGPNTMIEYYNNKEETDAVIKKHDDDKLWVHSGDIGYMTEDGFLFIVDRMKRMIVRHDGFKVFPSMIEKVVSTHYSVKTCCTVGTRDTEHSQGKLPVVHIVLKDEFKGAEYNIEKELIKLCISELPEYAQPIRYVFCESLPLTPIGKIDYRTLEEQNKQV